MSSMSGDEPPMAKPKGFFRGTLLLVNCMFNMAMYSIILNYALYAVMVSYTTHPWLRTTMMLYLPYIYFVDPSPTRGWKLPKWLRRRIRGSIIYQWFAEFFDAELIKEADLDPTQTYIFAYHPHGVIGNGFNTAFGTDGSNFDQVFPGVERLCVTLNATFMAPFFHEWILALGFICANKATLVQTLRSGTSVAMIPGGATEALYAHPGVFRLYLRQRKGFLKLGLETDSPVIPVLGFGENQVFGTITLFADNNNNNNTTSTWKQICWKMQASFKGKFGFSLPLLHPIPRPAKISVVCGKPVPIRNSQGEKLSIDEYHALYVERVKELYEKHKTKHGHGHIPLVVA